MKELKLEQILNNYIVQILLNFEFGVDIIYNLGVKKEFITKLDIDSESHCIDVNFVYNDVEYKLSLNKIIIDNISLYRYELKTKNSILTSYIDPDIGSYSVYIENDTNKEYNFTFKIKNTIITNEEITLEVLESDNIQSTDLILPEILRNKND